MNIYEFFPINVFVEAAYWLVTTLSELLSPTLGAQSAACAVILLTIAVRCALIPVGWSQAKANRTRQRLAPHIAELQRRWKKNPDMLQRKTMELYAKEKASPLAGCLPVLAQTPVLMAVSGVFLLPEIGGRANELLTQTLFGVPLDVGLIGQIAAGTVDWISAAVFVVIMLVIAVVAQLSRRLLAPPPTVQAPPAPGAPDLSGVVRVLSWMPFLTAGIAAVMPLAGALYLMTTTVWTLGERLVMTRILGAEPGSGSGKEPGRARR